MFHIIKKADRELFTKPTVLKNTTRFILIIQYKEQKFYET
jgi:hypothetical protein